MAMFDGMNEIKKYGGKKIISMEDILDSGQTRKVATTGSTMADIKEFLSLLMGEETT